LCCFTTTVLFLEKKNQNSSQQNASFAAHGLCPANQAEPQGGTFEPRRRTPRPTLQLEANALSTTQAIMFCPISPGSGLLSKKRSIAANQQVKRARG